MFNIFNKSAIPEITPEQARDKQQAGAIVIDVREPEEWNEGHIAGARHIPLGTIPQHLTSFETGKELVLVCRSGRRSMNAAQQLHKAGYTQVYNMAGGMLDWEKAGLPTSKK